MFEEIYSGLLPFWDRIPAEDRGYICDNSIVRTYEKGTNIHGGSECSGVIFVRRGSLRVYILSEDGKNVTLYRLHKGDMVYSLCSSAISSTMGETILQGLHQSA